MHITLSVAMLMTILAYAMALPVRETPDSSENETGLRSEERLLSERNCVSNIVVSEESSEEDNSVDAQMQRENSSEESNEKKNTRVKCPHLELNSSSKEIEDLPGDDNDVKKWRRSADVNSSSDSKSDSSEEHKEKSKLKPLETVVRNEEHATHVDARRRRNTEDHRLSYLRNSLLKQENEALSRTRRQIVNEEAIIGKINEKSLDNLPDFQESDEENEENRDENDDIISGEGDDDNGVDKYKSDRPEDEKDGSKDNEARESSKQATFHSMEGYVHGCEFMEPNADDANETTYITDK